MPVPFIVGFFALVVGVLALSWWLDKKHTEAMQAYAQSRGLTFEGDTNVWLHELRDFKLFAKGYGQRVKNAMRGAKDIGGVRVCDFQFTTGSGKNRHTYDHTIVVLHTPGRRAPPFFARRQLPLFDALGAAFGGQDINFDDDPEFSSRYVLQTSGDEQQLRYFMTSQLREALTRLSDRNLVLEASGELLVVHRGKRLKTPEDLDALMNDAVSIRRLWS